MCYLFLCQISETEKGITMKTLKEIQAILLDENSGMRDEIVRTLGTSTVALFAIDGSEADERLRFCGTGSLVQFANSHYILTAAHVWEGTDGKNGLKSSQRIGITMKEDQDHRHVIETRTLVSFGLPIPKEWNEWGPDLVFLRVPNEYVGRIQAVKSFYSLDRDRPKVKLAVEVLILMGAPGEFGKYTSKHVELNINGFFFDPNALPYRHGDFDYLDSKEDTKFSGVPKNFGGVSGGGLWRVQIFCLPETDKPDWKWFFDGVAFYQIPQPDEHMTIRCHGLESIQAAMKLVPANPRKRD